MSPGKSASALAVLAGLSVLAGCAERNLGIPACEDDTCVGIYFPAAMALDPRVPESVPSRFLFVANANSNLEYNAGSLVAVDLDKFFGAWMNCAEYCFSGTGLQVCQEQVDKRIAEQMYYEGMRQTLAAKGKSAAEIEAQIAKAREDEKLRRATDPCGPNMFVRDVGEDLDNRFGWQLKRNERGTPWDRWTAEEKAADPLPYEVFRPCRHLAFRPQVIECDDVAVLAVARDGIRGGGASGRVGPLSVRMGSFITDLEGWVRDRDADHAYLLAAVKADPSITWIELAGGLLPRREGLPDAPRQHERWNSMVPEAPTSLAFACGQGTGELNDPGRCARSTHALRYPYNCDRNPDVTGSGCYRIGPEPSNILVSKVKNLAYVTFATSPEVVLIDLDAPRAATGLPANEAGLVPDGDGSVLGASTTDTSGTGTTDASTTDMTTDAPGTGTTGTSTTGATTDAATTEMTTDAATTSPATGAATSDTTGAPAPSEPLPTGSTAPMIVDMRQMFVSGETVGAGWGLAERPCVPGSAEVPAVTTVPTEYGGEPVECARPLVYGSSRTGLYFARMVPDRVYPTPDQRCIGEGGVSGDEGAISCDPRLFFAGLAPAVGFEAGGAGQLGDIAFSRDGRRLFAVQSSPGALLFIDTSVDFRGETRDEPAGLVELCNGATRMALFEDGSTEYAAVSCSTPNQVFIVDLSGFRVVANIATGLGPHAIVVDRARRLLYVGNTLDRTISVIDVASDRPTRFAEIARIGQQQPYKR